MQVIYRITSIPSTNPSPIYQDNKDMLNEYCLRSFVDSFDGENIEITFLADHCSDDCISMIDSVTPFRHKIVRTSNGINQAMLNSYNLASKMDGTVLFQECDYLWQPYIGGKFIRAVEELKLVSPYDHLNFYRDKNLHSETCDIRLVDNHHYRTTERNTMTWATTADLVRDNLDILNKYGYLDGDVWYELKDRGHKLWVPVPSFATHMVKDYLAPGVKWL